MDLDDCVSTAYGLMGDFGLEDWTFKFDNAERRFGCCYHRRKLISLSASLVELNDEAAVMDTLLHEIAHALVGHNAGHGPVWQRMAAEIGCSSDRCYDNEETVTNQGPWVGICPGCGHEVRRWRQSAKMFRLACGQCCNGSYNPDYKFDWHYEE